MKFSPLLSFYSFFSILFDRLCGGNSDIFCSKERFGCFFEFRNQLLHFMKRGLIMSNITRKYAVITGFMGKVQDRFFDYQPARNIETMIKMASKIKGVKGMEVVYPQNFQDPVKTKHLLDDAGLDISAVNVNVKSEAKFLFGSFSNPKEESRQEAIKYLKYGMDCAAELGCDKVTIALLNDGEDYPFELNLSEAFLRTIEGIRECADNRKDVNICLEYKLSEPRVHCLLGNAGKMAYLCEKIGRDNVGVTLDTGHALQAQELIADSVAFLGATGKLFHVHVNDNFRNWDWDMVPGTINLWEFIEFGLYLKKVGYNGYITADVFPQRHDPIMIMERTFEWMDYIFDIVDSMDIVKTFEMMKDHDAFEMMEYVRSFVK
jgi:xylose isomerase